MSEPKPLEVAEVLEVGEKLEVEKDMEVERDAKVKEDAKVEEDAKFEEDSKVETEPKFDEDAKVERDAKVKEDAKVEKDAKVEEDAKVEKDTKAEVKEKDRKFTIFAKLPSELRVKIFQNAFPGRRLVIMVRSTASNKSDLPEIFEHEFEPKPLPVLQINRGSRTEALKKYAPIKDPLGKWQSHINYDTDTLLLALDGYHSALEEKDLPSNPERIKRLMINVYYYKHLPTCPKDGNIRKMSKEVPWRNLRKAFPNLEQLVIWTTDVFCGREYPSDKLGAHCRLRGSIDPSVEQHPEVQWDWKWWDLNPGLFKGPKLDFPWWDSNADLHSVCFKNIESVMHVGDYRVIQDVTLEQFALVKQAHPDWPLQSIRFVGGTEVFYDCECDIIDSESE